MTEQEIIENAKREARYENANIYIHLCGIVHTSHALMFNGEKADMKITPEGKIIT